MKKNHLWVLTATLIGCLMTVSACSVDDNEVPKDEQVFLNKMIFKTYKTGTDEVTSTTTEDLTWEDGLLKQIHSETKFKFGAIEMTSILDEYFTYEGGRCVQMRTKGKSGDETIRTFTYDDNGRLTKGVETRSTLERVVNINSYTADGHIQQIEYNDESDTGQTYKRRYDLTWKDGNIVKYTNHYIEPAEEDVTAELVYDNYPSPLTGEPVAIYIFGEPYQMCSQISKNNPIREGDEYTYKNGRVVQKKSLDTVTDFFYSDGIGN